MLRRHHAIVLAASILAAPLLTAGCSDDEKATPQVILESRLELGTTNCKDVGGLFNIGDFGNQLLDPKIPSRAVKDGESDQQGGVSVACAVTQAGPDEFDVTASASLGGATGGLFRVTGKFKTTGEQTGVNAVFSSRKSGNTYEQKDGGCVVRYGTSFQGVAAGRVWGEITCPSAENPGAQTACEGFAQFRFENCGQ